MPNFYSQDFSIAIREDMMQAFTDYWQSLSQPGPGWSAAQRIANAEEVRNATSCDYCQQRNHGLSLNSVEWSNL